MDSKIYICYGDNAAHMTALLMDRANVIDRIPVGASVALKPNLVVARSAENGATTHAGVLEGAMGYLRDHGVEDISLIEGSWVGDDTVRAYRACGYDEVCRRFNVPFYNLKRDETRAVDTPAGAIKICRRALEAGYLINLPVLKGHCQTVMTCSLKNLKGCLPDGEKRRFHAEGLHKPIAALATALRPQLTIVDGICGDLSFEEGGTPIQTNRMLLGEDMVKLDAFGCYLMGIDPRDVAYIGLAERYRVGTAKWSEEDLIELGDPKAARPFPKPRGVVARLAKGVTENKACSACYGSLMHALYRLDEEGVRPRMPIAIGQGMRGVAFDGVGVGRCCDACTHRIQGCPPKAQDIFDALKSL